METSRCHCTRVRDDEHGKRTSVRHCQHRMSFTVMGWGIILLHNQARKSKIGHDECNFPVRRQARSQIASCSFIPALGAHHSYSPRLEIALVPEFLSHQWLSVSRLTCCRLLLSEPRSLVSSASRKRRENGFAGNDNVHWACVPSLAFSCCNSKLPHLEGSAIIRC